MSIEPREYQLHIISRILMAKSSGKNVIVELDAGMGKRVIAFLLANYIEPTERMVFITPSRASVRDTYNFFEEMQKQGKLRGIKIGFLSTSLKSGFKLSILKKSNVIITTPITLSNILSKFPELSDFDYVFINEVDKVVRRVSSVPVYEDVPDYLATYQLVYPWPKLRDLLPKDACWVGLSGTLRDRHTVKVEGDVIFKRELETISKLLFPPKKAIDFIYMDRLIETTDAGKYIWRNLTIVRRIPIYDDFVKNVLDAISQAIADITKVLISKYVSSGDDVSAEERIEKVVSKLPKDDIFKIRFLRLALIRKFITASIPSHYSKYLTRPSIVRLIREKIPDFDSNKIPRESEKVKKIIRIASEWAGAGKKVTILTSYIITAKEIYKNLTDKGFKVFLLTGKTFNKAKVLLDYQNQKGGAILVLTPVGERDLDLPQTDLVLVFDVINTVKSMYQRFKRGRRAYVAIVYYEGTYEKEKVDRLLDRIRDRYPWSIVID
ncbi:MAG: DEAD/DEAH box helicase [Candidatus Njordarchaeia archaeon]